MINIFIPIVENVEGFCEFVAKHQEKGTRIYVGIRKSLKDTFVVPNKNVEVHVFEDRVNKEEILNGLQKIQRQLGQLLVVRRPLTDEEFVALTTSNSDIATLKAHHNKFVTWWKETARKIIKRFFAFSFFEDISAICYSAFLHDFISSCPNLSMATRINKYVGVDIEEIETTTPPVKKDYNKFKNALVLTAGVLLLAGSIAGAGCIFALVKHIRVIYVVLTLAMLCVTLTIFAITLINYTRTVAVGNLEYRAGEELEVVPAKDVEKTAPAENVAQPKVEVVAVGEQESQVKTEPKTAKPKTSKGGKTTKTTTKGASKTTTTAKKTTNAKSSASTKTAPKTKNVSGEKQATAVKAQSKPAQTKSAQASKTASTKKATATKTAKTEPAKVVPKATATKGTATKPATTTKKTTSKPATKTTKTAK